MPNTINPTTQGRSRYRVEAGLLLVAITVAFAIAIFWPWHGTNERWRSIVLPLVVMLASFRFCRIRIRLRSEGLSSTNPTARAGRRYLTDIAIFMTAATAISIFCIFHGDRGHWHTVVALSSAISLVFFFVAVVRYTLRTDELNQKIIVESSAIAGGTTALIALMYSFLEGSGYPKPHALWAYFTFMISWVIATLFFRRRYK
jgi:hypothetical protein